MARAELLPASGPNLARLSLSGELTIFEAQQTHAALLALQPQGAGPWELDLAEVSEIDSAGVQLLIALAKSLAPEPGALRLVAASATASALIELLQPAGLSPDPQRHLAEG